MLQDMEAQERDMTSLEIRIASKVNGITETLEYLSKESQAVTKDIGVFAAIKHLVTDAELEARTESINSDIKMLTAQTSGFVEQLNGYLLKTEAVENNFQEHIATAFAKVESEFSEIKDAVQGVHNAGADAGNAAYTASLQLAQHSLDQRTARIEAEHVAVKSELVEAQQCTADLTA